MYLIRIYWDTTIEHVFERHSSELQENYSLQETKIVNKVIWPINKLYERLMAVCFECK